MQRGVKEGFLLLIGQGADGVGKRGTDASLVEPVLCRGSEPGGEGMPASDPRLAASEQVRGRGEGEAIVADERIDDARLVHRRESARWGVGAENQSLVLRGGAGVLDDHGDVSRTRSGPASQPLEAIDDLEGAVFLRDDPQRQLRQWLRGLPPWLARTKEGEARVQPLDGQVDHKALRRRLGARRGGGWRRRRSRCG